MWKRGERGDGARRKTKNAQKSKAKGMKGHKADLCPGRGPGALNTGLAKGF